MVPSTKLRRGTGEGFSIDGEIRNRFGWWLKCIGTCVGIGAALFGVGSWFYSRASIADIASAKEQIQKELDSKANMHDLRRIEKRMDKTEEIILNVRDNVLILMDRQNVKAKPLDERDEQ